ncbi:hypothetical protein B0O99DRAFT_520340 [Bisporella sp. PMI_857]|nr:hypothetical protein B0O99DRAFT_520340 [Bisporella sp. PMI_857]
MISARPLLRSFICLHPFKVPRQNPLASLRFSSTISESKTRGRVDSILNRLPRFLHPYTSSLRNAPATNIVAFLILHEITAVLPLVGLAGAFHYFEWLPKEFTEAKYIREGVERFGKYFARKEWFGFQRVDISQKPGSLNEAEAVHTNDRLQDAEQIADDVEKKWGVSEGSSRILIEVATAYAITKLLLPARVVLSVWATPWFARIMGKIGGKLQNILGKKVKGTASTGPGANNTGSNK